MKNNVSEWQFALPTEDGWPPVSIEALWLEQLEYDVFINWTLPVFVKGLSVGDKIKVLERNDTLIDKWKILVESGNSVAWVMLLNVEKFSELMGISAKFRFLGCNTIFLKEFSILSIDIPANLSIKKIDEIIECLDESVYAVAYPSFQHNEIPPRTL